VNYKWLCYQNDGVFQFMLREQSVDALFRAIAFAALSCWRRGIIAEVEAEAAPMRRLPCPPAASRHRGSSRKNAEILHRPRRHWAGARVCLFRG
jgi:hypothetical protein